MDTQDFLLEALFTTNALQVCQPDNPFWYTSGKIGPYYINTHYLFGGRAAAENFLRQIERAAVNVEKFTELLRPLVREQYQCDPVYRQVIDNVCNLASSLTVDIISGGERRDFFFSLAVAAKMHKPHLAIFKDGRTCLSSPDSAISTRIKDNELEDQHILHIADLVTAASSYERAWLPAIDRLGGKIDYTLVIVDRLQGGAELLAGHNVRLHSLCRVESEFFIRACERGLISRRQLVMIEDFTADPDIFMRNFFREHPDFIDRQLAAGGKAAERARLCLQKGYASVADTETEK